MLRRTRRLLLPLAALALLTGMTACGSESDDPQAAGTDSATASLDASPTAEDLKALESVAVSGATGKEPTVKFADVVTVSGLATKTVSAGDGATLATGDSVFTQIWIGNGASKKKAYSTYDQKAQLLTLSSQLLPALNDGLVGEKVGSRVLIAAAPAKAYGDQGNPSLGIGNADTVVFVVDILNTIPSGPEGATRKPASWAPKVSTEADLPSSLDFKGTPDPAGKLQRTTLIQGTGAVTKKGDHAYVNYLGQVYGADKPFDDSYSRGTPLDFDLGTGGQPGAPIVGWDRMLTGVKVGSRVIIQIPPKQGYGTEGNANAGIKGTDTLYFLVDVLATN